MLSNTKIATRLYILLGMMAGAILVAGVVAAYALQENAVPIAGGVVAALIVLVGSGIIIVRDIIRAIDNLRDTVSTIRKNTDLSIRATLNKPRIFKIKITKYA